MIAALPSDWVITYQEVEDLRVEAARLPAEIAALQDRLAIVRRKVEAADYLIADKARQQRECSTPEEGEGRDDVLKPKQDP